MSSTDLSSYKNLYLQTSRSHVEQIKSLVSKLVNDNQNKSYIEQLYVAFHSLASSSEIIGYRSISLFCRSVEHFLLKVKQRSIALTKEQIEVIASCSDRLEQSLIHLREENKEIDLTDETTKINNLV